MRTLLIINGSSEQAEQVAELGAELIAPDDLETHVTQTAGEAAERARSAVDSGVARLIVAGGDGTLNQVINGLAPDFDAVQVGLIPLGTGNDFSRCLQIPLDDPSAAFELALHGREHRIDLIRFTGEPGMYFHNIATGGYGGKVAEQLQKEEKSNLGALAYWIKGIQALSEISPYDILLSIDGVDMHIAITGIAIANGRYIGGGAPISVTSVLDDGRMDVIFVSTASFLETVSAGIDLAIGRYQDNPHVFHALAESVTIQSQPKLPFSIDGELVGEVDGRFDIVPRALRIVGNPAEGVCSDNSDDD